MASKPNSTTAPTCDSVSSGTPPYLFDRPCKRCMHLGWELILQQNSSPLPAKAHVAAVKAPKQSFFLSALSFSLFQCFLWSSPSLSSSATTTPPLQEHSDPRHLWKWPGRIGNSESWWGSGRTQTWSELPITPHTWNEVITASGGKLPLFPHFSLVLTQQHLFISALCTEAVSLTSKLPPPSYFQDETE